jgi:hypothetical protein
MYTYRFERRLIAATIVVGMVAAYSMARVVYLLLRP